VPRFEKERKAPADGVVIEATTSKCRQMVLADVDIDTD
jgi:hypothetical protein